MLLKLFLLICLISKNEDFNIIYKLKTRYLNIKKCLDLQIFPNCPIHIYVKNELES